MQFHHHGYVSADPRVQEPAGAGVDRPAELPDEMDVLIVGSGPAGMLLAAQMSQFPDVTTRIIERRDGRLVLGQADGIQPRSVETFQAFGFAERIVAARDAEGPFRDLRDVVRRTGITAAQVEALATAGAFECLGVTRREAIWMAGSAAQDRAEYLPDSMVSVQPPLFADQSSYDILAADLWATGISTDDHPLAHYRSALDARGVLTSREMRTHETGRRVEVAGLVTHRQRPATASGVTFLNLEDEHGVVNVICSVGVWNRHRRVARDAPALIVRGMLERSPEGVTNLLADRFEDLRVGVVHASRDFR
ncbi:helix-hairpin-helix domain-containing protein [Microbacterium aurantiacum]|uniref:helix-hairpin-helix domain-containing protein n=1 Tax=Microbacterium aurantiacum TaxID=162393 RepID=UPI00403811E8